MAATSLIEGEMSKDFLERLRSSAQIEIEIKENTKPGFVIIRLPQVLVCEISSKFRDLCKDNPTRHRLTLGDILGDKCVCKDVVRQLQPATFLDYMTWFVQWLYTCRLQYNKDMLFYNMWKFGEWIGCPKLQNEALKMLASNAPWQIKVRASEVRIQYHFADINELQNLWDDTELENDPLQGAEEEPVTLRSVDKRSVYWGNKKRLLFLMDGVARFGPDDPRVMFLLAQSPSFGFQLIKRLVDLAKEGGDVAPWAPRNIHKYLVDENLFEENPYRDVRERSRSYPYPILGHDTVRMAVVQMLFIDNAHVVISDDEPDLGTRAKKVRFLREVRNVT